jgi:myo-inositol catabolism protein IolC
MCVTFHSRDIPGDSLDKVEVDVRLRIGRPGGDEARLEVINGECRQSHDPLQVKATARKEKIGSSPTWHPLEPRSSFFGNSSRSTSSSPLRPHEIKQALSGPATGGAHRLCRGQ